MKVIAPQTTIIDVEHLGRPGVIGACLIERAGSAALIDPGPGSTAATLIDKLAQRGLTPTDLDAVLLTHIHLDHAGATGTLVAQNPELVVYVHERGLPHVVDPSRLIKSARRLWPDDLDELWGECLPVPAENVRALTGGERIAIGTRQIEVVATPGHASHHVCYLDRDTGTAFVGDTGGVRIANSDYVLPPTPPPDIDPPAWKRSVASVRKWAPERLVLTHFGVAEPVDAHLDELLARLDDWTAWAREELDADHTDQQRMARFVRLVERSLRRHLDEPTTRAILQASPPELCWMGLARYLTQSRG